LPLPFLLIPFSSPRTVIEPFSRASLTADLLILAGFHLLHFSPYAIFFMVLYAFFSAKDLLG
ncbi:MAG: hypothetical protein ACP5KV_06970, partial [Candidatus Methanomethylicaceae archaeon]